MIGPPQILPIDRRHDRLILRTGLAGLRREILVIPMIETRQAVENIDEILDVPGIDAIYVGPADLAFSLGKTPKLDSEDAEQLDMYEVLLAACRKRGIYPGVHYAEPALCRPHDPDGFQTDHDRQQQRTDGPSCAGGGRWCLAGNRRVSIGAAFSLRLVPPRRGLTGPLFGGARDRDCRRSAASFEVACGLPPLERNSLDFPSYRYRAIESRFFPGPPQIEAQAPAGHVGLILAPETTGAQVTPSRAKI